eukprot:CAMPEP_0201544542 /NCGR_PEP_ID=MMETSP0173_2-20130828/1170_1 /ASSEMBLY_ACC=CAM_ASM_000268 /TAXON_ID=218659 /ORGANISM="Vexillifera sp., Strain DIVA3 564/2" /LENGTH=784 /DNA_ID=CAMNT_0047952697 /DNA_START=216 /DNA_END=2570 /DNA_ORIENTATION=-
MTPGQKAVQMHMIPPRYYVTIDNPVARDASGSVVLDKNGNYKLRHGDKEIRFEQDPFPLYPGETAGALEPLVVVPVNQALLIHADRDFEEHQAGDEWYFQGPGTYVPRVECSIVKTVEARVIQPNTALRLRALRQTTDYEGNPRKDGEEWLVRRTGAYLPSLDEAVVDTVKGEVLTQNKALHLRAKRTYTDVYGVKRKAGSEWLVKVQTFPQAAVHIPDVYEEKVRVVNITILNKRQYVVVLDPIGADERPQLGKRVIRRGEQKFFLHPGEKFEDDIKQVHLLSDEDAVLLRAKENFTDSDGKERQAGDRWMVYGPAEYVPDVEVEIVEFRRAIPLDENEGIYVRDIKVGRVRSIVGKSYMLRPNEELWEKELPKTVEQLLLKANSGSSAYRSGQRDKTRVVTFRAAHNSAVQIYDYKKRQSRVIFGPSLVMLQPEEDFTVLSLSGGKPKRPHQIKSLALLLGPDFMTDIVTVETSDHARLKLRLSYNWEFSVDSEADGQKLFNVPDFVGDGCKAIAGRVRSAVASTPFDEFHRFSARIIRTAVFGLDPNGKVNNSFVFSSNNLTVTNIDIQAVEPVDRRTRDSLMESVQLAIEITTKSQEARARHEANRKEQEAKGLLQRERIKSQAASETARSKLVQLKAACAEIQASGRATAEAKARGDAANIQGQANVQQAKDAAEAQRIRREAEHENKKLSQDAELAHKRALTALEIQKSRKLAEIESRKFKLIVDAVGAETIAKIAQAGPEMQAQLLEGLGLESFLITDGNSPVNLFQTANGLLQTKE